MNNVAFTIFLLICLASLAYTVPTNCNERQRRVLTIDTVDTLDIDEELIQEMEYTDSVVDNGCKDKNICSIDCSKLIMGCKPNVTQKYEIKFGMNYIHDMAFTKTCIYRIPNGIKKKQAKEVTPFEQIYNKYVALYTDIKHASLYQPSGLLKIINNVRRPHREVFNAVYYYERLLYGFMDLCKKHEQWKDNIKLKLLHYFTNGAQSVSDNKYTRTAFKKWKQEESKVINVDSMKLYTQMKEELNAEMIKQIQSETYTFCDCYDLYHTIKSESRKEGNLLKQQIIKQCNKLC